ncbi:MAG: flippase-like domain-containing protein [Bacteriovoracaceae bacterium]|nr:flippase-like domain-containing protein [Bacteriovoracaceae bacterium]
MRDSLKMVLKVILAVAIISWLLKSGKLDFSLINKSFEMGYGWLLCLAFLITQDCLSGIRWRWLLKVNSQAKFPFIDMIRVTWIGLFFNSFLPGAVTGDFIKLLYIRDLDPKMSKTYLVTSVLMDRILGLMGLLVILGIFSTIFYGEIVGLSGQMANLVHFNLLLFAGAIVFIGFLFAPRKLQDKVLKLSQLIPVLGNKIHNTLMSVWTIGDNKIVLFKCIALSMFLQAMNFGAFYLISSPFYGADIPFKYIVTLIPIGFMAVAIPISPAGLGVGHVIFDKLFSFVGIEGGANFFNLYFVAMVFINSFGFLPYIFGGRQHSLKEAEAFDAVTEKL